ncbi:TlpA disulfide reductase family protein [Chitinophaga sp. sic0106]|uniref:TlpA disulfide reductase family protein n=1 Tax=Chitinophaga sp. sic0106 TaxID=2854785 RepID=UPI001C48DBFA|nr:TlpA disulfide reductase family protein [Chitinophaga sp. sic0106]MBV7530676.1 AhpC/TSA family protein [Chitinophaga sp. sic0106]
MKKQLIVCALLAAAACKPVAPKHASITADIKGITDSIVHIMVPVADSARTDSAVVTNGRFTWSGDVGEAQKIYIGTSTRYIDLYMGNDAVEIKGNIDSIENLVITGSPAQDEYKAFTASIKDVTDQEHALYGSWEEAHKTDSGTAAIENKLETLRSQRHDRTVAYIRSHPASAISVNMLADMAVMGEYAPLDSLYKTLDPAVQQGSTGTRLAKRLAILKRSAIGAQMMDFTQNDTNGKPVTLSDLKGKYVLVDFWASWCGPCRAENPNVLKAYNAFKDKNFTVVGVSLDDNEEKWKAAIKQDGMPWIQLSDLKGWRNEVAQQYGIQGIPFSLLIDPDGKIVAKELRGTKLHNTLASLLNNQKPAI